MRTLRKSLRQISESLSHHGIHHLYSSLNLYTPFIYVTPRALTSDALGGWKNEAASVPPPCGIVADELLLAV
jgi:hypothetical protein